MKYQVRLLPLARSDLIRISDFLGGSAPPAALRAARVLDSALTSLGRFPERTPRSQEGGRDLLVPFGQAGYVIRYRIEGAAVVIVRIFHTREDRSG